MKLNSISAAASLAIALLAMNGAAFAAGGNVTSASMNPTAVFPGENVSLKVGVTGGSFGIDCMMRWTLKNPANAVVKGGSNIRMTSNGAPSAEHAVSFGALEPGVYTLEAGPGTPTTQAVICLGNASATLTVKDKNAISAIPAATTLTPRPQPIQVVQLPDSVLQLPKLTAIKQAAFTNHSGETWIEVQGTGNCAFTIESAGVATASFAASAAKPFPMKVKIDGAPLGSHNWKAQGTGSCSGVAVATFSVD